MAAPFKHRVSNRLVARIINQFNLSSSHDRNSFNFISTKQKFNTFVSSNYSVRRSPKFWLVATLTGGSAAIVLLSQVTKNKAFKVFAEKEQEIPYFKPSRQVQTATDNSGLRLTLYQFQTCPFCCKVRAVLDYYGLSYDVIEVNSVTKKQMKWSSYSKVPILVIESNGSKQTMTVKDSSVIISLLESYLRDSSTSLATYHSYYPCMTETAGGKTKYDFPNKYFIMFQENTDLESTSKQRNEERKWRQWADDHLVHMLSPNAYRTVRESLHSFHYFSEVGQWEQNFSFMERYVVIYVGAAVMYVMGMILKSRYSLKDDVRQSLYDACDEWLKAVGKDRLFMGGNQPNLADLAVYGILNSIEGCNAFKDVLENTKIGPWYNRTKTAVQNHQGCHPLNTKSSPSDKPKQKEKI